MEDFALKAVWFAVWLVLMASLVVTMGLLAAIGFQLAQTVF